MRPRHLALVAALVLAQAALSEAGPGRVPRHGVRPVTRAKAKARAKAPTPKAVAVTVSVDASSNRHPIDPRVYGVAFADTATLQDLGATLNRWGGNSAGRYNWQQNIDNRGADWYFESIPYASSTPGAVMDSFIASTKSGGAEPFLTMPMVGWVARTNPARDILYSFSINTYGNQTDFDPFLNDAGNGCQVGADVFPCFSGTPITPPTSDPNDASVPADGAFQQDWMQHVRNTWGPASTTGLKYWGLDNEPSIWQWAYWDVHPDGPGMDEMRDKMIDYGSRLKSVDPGVQILGPEEWGWSGYFWSGMDQQAYQQGLCPDIDTCPDRVAHGGQDYVPYLLDRMRNHQTTTGQRILDVLTLHYYPQAGEFSSDVTTATQLLRNRSTRGLWDPAYVDESWIGVPVRLIPRMKDWVNTYYLGTEIGITEYNWGAESHINGATTQADILGIFGREGLDLATRWVVPDAGTPVYNAFKMYRNYDGAHSAFGDVSVQASAPSPDDLAVFAAQRTGSGALTIMAINKALPPAGPTSTTVNLANFAAGTTAQVWRLDAGNVITQLANVTVTGNSFTASLPAQTLTLFVVAGSGGGPVANKFYTVQPCRVADTRNPPGPSGGPALAANTLRTFPVTGLCGIPSDGRAVALNVVAVGETDTGDLRLFPAGGAAPLASTINFAVGHVRANNAVITLGTGGALAVQCDMPPASTGSTHVVIDVYGYYK